MRGASTTGGHGQVGRRPDERGNRPGMGVASGWVSEGYVPQEWGAGRRGGAVPRPSVRPGTVVVFTDVMCGWSTVALHRFYRVRHAGGLDAELRVDLQLYLLEDVNQMALNWRTIEPEKPVVGSIAEDLGFTSWQRDLSEYPVTSLPANEAVHAAKDQSLQAAEELAMALRLAFWRDSRCVSLLHEILDVAGRCPHVDAGRLARRWTPGRRAAR